MSRDASCTRAHRARDTAAESKLSALGKRKHSARAKPRASRAAPCLPTGLAWGRHGATATHLVWPERCVIPLPSALSFDSAAVLTCAGGTAYTIVRETRLTAGDRLAVVGLGPVGLSLVILAKALGASVVGIDLDKAASIRRPHWERTAWSTRRHRMRSPRCELFRGTRMRRHR